MPKKNERGLQSLLLFQFGTITFRRTFKNYFGQFVWIETSRDRPKSAPYPRLKNSKTTSKCQVLFYSTRKSKFFEKKFFEKITYSKKMDRVARRGSLARAPGALKSHNAEKLKGRTL